MKYIAIVNDKDELIAARQIDEAAISTGEPITSPAIKSGQKVVEIDIPTEAAKKSIAGEIMQQMKGELQRMKR